MIPPYIERFDATEALDGDRTTYVQARLLGALLTLASLDAASEARWEPSPAEPRERTLGKPVRDGSTRAEMLADVSARCSIDEITLRLRELGINARGTKQALASRLLDADPAFAQSRFQIRPLDTASTDNVYAACPNAPGPLRSTRTVVQFLTERDIEGAIKLSIELAFGPMSQGSLGANLIPKYRGETRRVLRRIFTSWPDALGSVSPTERGAYRVAAGVMALSERRRLPEWVYPQSPAHRLTGKQIATLVLRAAEHEIRRQRWRDAGITHARVVFAGRPCPACGRLRNRMYNLRGLPPLPPRDCACDGGYTGHLVAYRKARTLAGKAPHLI